MRKIKKRSEEERQRILKGYCESGMEAVQYCKKIGLPKSTLLTWIKKASLKKSTAAKFIKIKGLKTTIAESVKISTSRGHIIELPVSAGEEFIGTLLKAVLQ